MTAVKTLGYYDTEEISALLVGRRIIAAEEGAFERPDRRWGNKPAGKLTLDDGTVILVAPNEGCGGCSSGWYELTSVAACENVITSVRLEGVKKGDRSDAWSYRICVVADATDINAIQVDGDDGNGYYGTGYELIVTMPLQCLGTEPGDATGTQP